MEIVDIDGIYCNGIKKEQGLGIVKCKGVVAGVFTKNKLRSASVEVCKEHVSDGYIEGLIVNSGTANAYTGENGINDAKEVCKLFSKLLNCNERDVAIASTGIIGRRIDVGWIKNNLPSVYKGIGNTKLHANRFANAITTTDRFPKKSYSNKIAISAVAKGAGMIAPNMSTMLCFIFTTAKFDSGELHEMLKSAVDNTFNMLTVDGDTSPNDTVLLISNQKDRVERDIFEAELEKVCYNIAKMIAKDGEGSTKVFEVEVTGAKSFKDAKIAAKSIASSLLVKTAIFGNDPNWGRIIAALGYSGALVKHELSLSFESKNECVKLIEKGKRLENEGEAKKFLERNNEFKIKIDLHLGDSHARAIGCDLTHDYVKLNSEYTS